jgi:enterochelin esterase-like enzyme
MKDPWKLSRWALLPTLLLAACGRMHKEPFEKVPLAPGQVERVQLSERKNLVVERVRFWSNELKEPRFFLALVPKTHSAPSEVFILNHGWSDRPEYLLRYLKVDRVYDEMLDRDEVRPAILILPDVRFSNAYRKNARSFPFPNYLTLLAEEVAGTVARLYAIPPQRQNWAIGGFSFGGHVALDVARRYPGRFSSVSVISGFADSEWTYWPAQAPPSGLLDSQGRSKDTIVVPGPAPRLFLAVGSNDRLFATMVAMHQELLDLGFRQTWSTGPGGHTWKYWSSVLPAMLRFHLGRKQNQVEVQ